jgi:phosphoglycerate dehydrogenase-like enzyme
MTKPSSNEIVIAYQINPEFERLVAPRLPDNVRLVGLTGENKWDIPDEATILVPGHPGGGGIPSTPIDGWPRNIAWLQTQSTGIDNYPKWLFEGPVVSCARGMYAVPIAEFVLASMLAVEKHFPEIWATDRSQWKPVKHGSLNGKTLGILGFGGIGEAIAERALPFGMKVLATRRSQAPSAIPGVTLTDFDRTIAEADHLVLAVPLTPETDRMIDATALAKVKPGVHIINIARGGVIDQDALLAALDDNRVGFASLDVTTPEPLPDGHPLYTHPRVNISPHVSAGGWIDYQVFADFFLDNLNRFLAGEPPVGLVKPENGY